MPIDWMSIGRRPKPRLGLDEGGACYARGE